MKILFGGELGSAIIVNGGCIVGMLVGRRSIT